MEFLCSSATFPWNITISQNFLWSLNSDTESGIGRSSQLSLEPRFKVWVIICTSLSFPLYDHSSETNRAEEPQEEGHPGPAPCLSSDCSVAQERKLTHCLSEELSSLKGLRVRSRLATALVAFPLLRIMVGPLMMLSHCSWNYSQIQWPLYFGFQHLFVLIWHPIFQQWEEKEKDEEGLLELSLFSIGLNRFSFLLQLLSRQGRFRTRAVWL